MSSRIVETHQGLAGGFLHELSPEDLERLRTLTRRVHKFHRPHEPELNDELCDILIDGFGPRVAMDSLKWAVDKGQI